MKSIRSQITAMMAVGIIISVFTIGAVSMQYIRNISTTYLQELLMLKCESIGSDLNGYFEGIEQCVDTVAYYASSEIEGTSDEELRSCLKDIDTLFQTEVKRTDGVITYYCRIAPEVSKTEKGFWYSRYGSDSFESAELTDLEAYDENDPSRTAWYYIPKENGYATWLEPYNNDNLGGVKMISYVTPLYVNGRFIGVAGIDYDYEELVKHLTYDGHFRDAYTFLVGRDNTIIYHPEISFGTQITEISEALDGSRLSKNQSVIEINYNGDDQDVTWGALKNGMRIYLAVPERSLKEYWFRFSKTFLMIAAMLLALFIGISILLSGRFTKPLTSLIYAARRIDAGNYDVDLDYEGNNEIGILTRSFRQLVDHLRIHIQDLNDKAYKDALTSLRNKGAFDILLQKIDDNIKYAPEGRKPEFAICVFDCNNLKTINDTYGHDKGDMFIKTSCKLICDVFDHSPVFRLGGDEFACVLQGADYNNRVELCTAFERDSVDINSLEANIWDKVDIASGIAVYDPDIDKSTQDVFKRADQMMYEDKERKKAGIVSSLLECGYPGEG